MFRFYIPTMVCGGCAGSVTRALQSADAQARITTDTTAREVRIETLIDEATLISVLAEAGHPAQAVRA